MDQLIDLGIQQMLTIADLHVLDLRGRGSAVPILNRDLVGRAVNRDPEIVHLATQHEIKRIDRRAVEQSVSIARRRIRILHHVLPIAPVEQIGVVASASVEHVVALAPAHRVVAGCSRERVGRTVARQDVVQRVTRAIDRCRPGQCQVLNVGGQGVGHTALHRVSSVVCRFDHGVTGPDRIGVVPGPAGQHVGRAVACENVVQRVASAIDRTGSCQRQVFHVRSQRVRHGALHRIEAIVGQLDDKVARAIHHVGVVAIQARHAVGPRAAIEHIGGIIPGQHVGEAVARPIDSSRAGQHQQLDIGAQRRGHIAEHRIGPGVGGFDDRVAGADDIGIITRAPRENICGAVTGQNIIEAVAGPIDRGRARQGEGFEVGAQGPAHIALHRIDACIRRLDHRISGTHDIGVVAGPSSQYVRGTVARQDIVQRVAGAVDGRGAREREVLDIGPEGVRHRALHAVGPFVCQLGDDIPGCIHDVGVIPRATDQGIRPRPAIQHVGRAIAGQDIVQRITGAVQIGRPGQRQVLEVGSQGIGDRRLHRVVAFVELFGDHVAHVVDDIRVVARATDQGIRPGSAIQHVVAAVARQHIVHRVTGAVDGGRAR